MWFLLAEVAIEYGRILLPIVGSLLFVYSQSNYASNTNVSQNIPIQITSTPPPSKPAKPSILSFREISLTIFGTILGYFIEQYLNDSLLSNLHYINWLIALAVAGFFALIGWYWEKSIYEKQLTQYHIDLRRWTEEQERMRKQIQKQNWISAGLCEDCGAKITDQPWFGQKYKMCSSCRLKAWTS